MYRIMFNIDMAQIYLQIGETSAGEIGDGAYAVIYSVKRQDGAVVARKVADSAKAAASIERELSALKSPGAKQVAIVNLMVCFARF